MAHTNNEQHYDRNARRSSGRGVTMWRWDQGRMSYFQYDILKQIAKVLVQFDHWDLIKCENFFRGELEYQTEMPFSPSNYTIQRNYSRVFQCSFLANFIEGKLVVTDVCRDLADVNGEIECVDDYLFNHIVKFRFPFPAFNNYNDTEERIYPFCAIIKYLIAKQESGKDSKVSLDEIFSYVIGTHCTGLEDISHYKTLTPIAYKFTDTERRQLREMIKFISQLSFLYVDDSVLYLDTLSAQTKKELAEKVFQPENETPDSNRIKEFYNMTSFKGKIVIPTLEVIGSNSEDIAFIEGDKRRVEHFRIERNSHLRKAYHNANPVPICCACGLNMTEKYPWTDYMLDIHHLLPLSSSVAISAHGTSLADIVGLCPSCHRAVHTYYRKWLKKHGVKDFRSKKEAGDVYQYAKEEINE